MEAMSGAAQVSAMNKAMDPSSPAVKRMGALGMMHAPVEPAAFKVPKRGATEPKFLGSARDPLNYFVHMKTQESFSSPGSGSSAMGVEAKSREDSADKALALMGDPQRVAVLPGYESIPLVKSIPLIRQALVLAGVKSTIESACSPVAGNSTGSWPERPSTSSPSSAHLGASTTRSRSSRPKESAAPTTRSSTSTRT